MQKMKNELCGSFGLDDFVGPNRECFLIPIDECPRVVGEWIRVDDALPKEGKVWALGRFRHHGSREVVECSYYPSVWSGLLSPWRGPKGYVLDVTHWMAWAKPSPPREDIEKNMEEIRIWI